MPSHAALLRNQARCLLVAIMIAAVAILGWSSRDGASAPASDRSSRSIISAEIAVGSFALLVRVTAR